MKRWWIAGGLMMGLLGAIQTSRAASTATIGSQAQQEIKGWGIFPSYHIGDSGSSQIVARPDVQQALYADLGITLIKVDLRPTYCNSDGSLNFGNSSTGDGLDYLVSHIKAAQSKARAANRTIEYVTCVWSPPVYMKDVATQMGQTSSGTMVHLKTSSEAAFVQFTVKALKYLQAKIGELPVAHSLQNEPVIGKSYYPGCVYPSAQYRRVAALMRAQFDLNGLGSVKLLVADGPGYYWNGVILGQKRPGDNYSSPYPRNFDLLDLNPALAGAMSSHSYGSETFQLRYYNNAALFLGSTPGGTPRGLDLWQSEYSRPYDHRDGYAESRSLPAAGDNMDFQLDWAIAGARHFAADMVLVRNNYWFWWRGWSNSKDRPDPQDLLWGDGTSAGQTKRTKLFYVFAKLWNIVRPGWKVRPMTINGGHSDGEFTTGDNGIEPGYPGYDPDLNNKINLVAFENAGQMAVLMANHLTTSKTLVLNGLSGQGAQLFRTSSGENMAPIGSVAYANGQTTLTLAPRSITLLVTNPNVFSQHINFQPLTSPEVAGYEVDSGQAYSDARGFGWNVDAAAYASDRAIVGVGVESPDARYATLIRMQDDSNPAARTWRIKVPPGTYTVRIVAGDAAYDNSVYKINAEGVPVVSGTPNVTNRWISGNAVVKVTDGFLDITNGPGSYRNKICFIDITSP